MAYTKEQWREYMREYNRRNPEKRKERERRWIEKNPEKRKEVARRSKEKHKAKNDAKHRIWLANNRERVKTKHKEWIAKNRKRMLARMVQRIKERLKTDPAFRLKYVHRAALARLIKRGAKKKSRSLEYLGCTPDQARAHIERLWVSGMTWANHSRDGWHIDHIRPLASFDLTQDAQLRAALHYTNLQPLWAADNLAKADNII